MINLSHILFIIMTDYVAVERIVWRLKKYCFLNIFEMPFLTGISSTLEDWKIFLTKTLTGALAAPMDLFREVSIIFL